MNDCRFGVSPVNYPIPDPDPSLASPPLPSLTPLSYLAFPTLRYPLTRPLASPILPYPSGLSRPYPTILSLLLLFPRIPSPTYLPSNPYPTLAFPTLRSPPLSSTLLYHIHPDRSRGRNVSFPTSTLTLPYSTLPSPTIPTTPYPTLPIYFLPFHSSTLASHPRRSSPLP